MSSVYRWKSFYEEEDRPEKPRSYGVTEMRSPNYTLLSQNLLQVIFILLLFVTIMSTTILFIITTCLLVEYVAYKFVTVAARNFKYFL